MFENIKILFLNENKNEGEKKIMKINGNGFRKSKEKNVFTSS